MKQKIIGALAMLMATTWAGQAVGSPAEHLAQALTYRTISHQDRALIDYGELEKLRAFLRATYPRVFAELEVELVADHSLLLQWPGTDPEAQPILFIGHMDVVPVEPGTEGDWEHPPYGGVISEGKIYGRGTLDDKQGVIGLLEAAEQLLAEGFQPRRGIVLAFGHDEEISGREGAVAIAARMRELGLHFAWMVDEGGVIISDNSLLPDRPMAMINVAEKSYLTLTLTATGPGGHSSRPPAVSTIGRLSAALAKIEANPFEPRLVGPVAAMLEALAPYSPQPNRFAMANQWLTGGLLASQMAADPEQSSFVRTTTALTMFNAGVKENVVPQQAQAKVNFRLLPGDTTEGVISYIETLIDDSAIEITHEDWAVAPPVADYSGGGYAVISEAVKAVYPEALVVPSLLAGATDSRHFATEADNHYRFHGVVMTTEQAGSVHGTNEFISVESFEKSIEIAEQMMRLGSN
ncbi:MAG: M20/M25/M40 family metallo-hydrolase [Halioglobus sp.]